MSTLKRLVVYKFLKLLVRIYKIINDRKILRSFSLLAAFRNHPGLSSFSVEKLLRILIWLPLQIRNHIFKNELQVPLNRNVKAVVYTINLCSPEVKLMEIVESQVLVLLLYMTIFYEIFIQLMRLANNEEGMKRRTRQTKRYKRSSRNLLMMRLIRRN